MKATFRAGRALVTPLLAAALASAACGKTTTETASTSSGAGGHGTTTSTGAGGTGSGGGVTTLAPGCPATEPAEGGACPKPDLRCEYGTDFDPLCNHVLLCTGASQWVKASYPAASPSCPTVVPTLGANPAECAASPADVPVEQACTKEVTCEFDGTHCFCGGFCESYPVGHIPCDADAGIVTDCCDLGKLAWHCFGGPAYCPTPRPGVGTPCTTEGAECAVEVPGECGQAKLACKGGVWDVEVDSCPISTRRAKDEIAYLDDAARARLRGDLAAVRLATYRYKRGDSSPHLGFVIEDMPSGSPAVMPSRERVDLYGYVSMAVAALQEHEREIAALRAEVARLAAENAALAGKKPRAR